MRWKLDRNRICKIRRVFMVAAAYVRYAMIIGGSSHMLDGAVLNHCKRVAESPPNAYESLGNILRPRDEERRRQAFKWFCRAVT
jgi:hypothetical protein